MPCYDERNEAGWQEKNIWGPERKRLQERNDELAEMLCFIMRNPAWLQVPLRNLSPDDKRIADNLDRWWDNHQKFDKKRKRKK